MALKDIQIKALKPRDKVYRVTDSDGLAIEVKPTGVKLWRFRYRFDGKANMLGLGEYPTVSLLLARKMRDDARELLAQGNLPFIKTDLASIDCMKSLRGTTLTRTNRQPSLSSRFMSVLLSM